MSGGGEGISQALLKSVRGSFWPRTDLKLYIIIGVSLLVHGIFVVLVNTRELPPQKMVVLEEMPERFAKLIIEKPIPKADKKPKNILAEKRSEKSVEVEQAKQSQQTEEVAEQQAPPRALSDAERAAARKAINRQTVAVEQKMRTVGVLGMLTGSGTTARGPAVVDVLGASGNHKEQLVDLESALQNMSGLKKTQSADILNQKLVRSKDVGVVHKEEITDLVSAIQTTPTSDLVKRGNFVIQRPESIEGAASSNALRDNTAINKVVSDHRVSIRMSYEKFLQRDPTLKGKVTVRFTIAADGSVSAVQILENTTGNADLEAEIIRKVKMWTFDPVPDGDVSVTYPFVFSPS